MRHSWQTAMFTVVTVMFGESEHKFNGRFEIMQLFCLPFCDPQAALCGIWNSLCLVSYNQCLRDLIQHS